ncbi:MAG TPA: TMEM175 family protein [Terriglobales bacterium]|jgi:uncharacterized membrane protein|nr:TMEM175 family protein [Terriglobales bacterium]
MRDKFHRQSQSAGVVASAAESRPETNGSEEQIASEWHWAAEHSNGLQPEKYFRWRSGEITRLEAFCDVVFGFAVTLLVVSTEVPHTYAELLADMRGFLPFAICFWQLVMIWRTHYRFSRRYGLEDPYTVFLNVVLLFVVLFYVYPLKFVFTLLLAPLTGAKTQGDMGWHEGSVLMRIYGAGFAAVFSLVALMYAHAYKLRGELGLNPVEAMETLVEMRENAILAMVGMGSFVIAFRSPEWAGWFYMLLLPGMWIHGAVSGKGTRALAHKVGLE